MKNCILKKWYINILIFFIFGISFMFYINQNEEKIINCSTHITKNDCKTHLEKLFLDKLIPKNDIEKLDTGIILENNSKTYIFFKKYGKFLGFIASFLAMIIIFILYGIKFILGLGKYKSLNILSLFIGYGLVFLLGLNFLYWEPRYTEIGVAGVYFLGQPLVLISFYILVLILTLLLLKSISNLFINK